MCPVRGNRKTSAYIEFCPMCRTSKTFWEKNYYVFTSLNMESMIASMAFKLKHKVNIIITLMSLIAKNTFKNL